MRLLVFPLLLLFFPTIVDASEVTVFKWRDAQGRWHYGEKAPKSAHQELKIDTEANVTAGSPFAQASKKAASPRATAPHSPSNVAPGSSSKPDIGLPYTPGRVQKMLDDIKGIKKSVGQRAKVLDGL